MLLLSGARAREVRGWLRERITLEQAEARYAAFDRDWLACCGGTAGWLEYLQDKIVAEMRLGDELWLYDTGPEAWSELRGDQGLAHVRDGQVVGLLMERMN